MHSCRRLGSVVALAGTLLLPLRCLAAEPMHWILADLPPISRPINGQPGDGFSDETLKIVTEAWPEVEHRYTVASAARIWKELAAGTNVCYPLAAKTPAHDEVAYISLSLLVPPAQLVVRKELISQLQLNDRGEVDLPALLIQRGIKGVVPQGRSYGNEIDRLIAERPEATGLEIRPFSDLGKYMLKMVALGRADYTIETAYSVTYQTKGDPSLATLQTIPIAGVRAPNLGGFACPRTPWGRQMIQKIDSILIDAAKTSRFRVALEELMSPKELNYYRSDLQRFYRERETPTDRSKFE